MSPGLCIFVKKASAGTEGVGQTQLLYHKHVLPAFFALSSPLCCQNMLTDNADVPDFSTLFNTLKLQAGHEVVLLLRSLEC